MKMNRLLSILLPAALMLLAGCAVTVTEPEAPSETEIAAEVSEAAGPAALTLSMPEASVRGVSYKNGVFTVTEAGSYRVTGTLEGQLVVDAEDPVELILAGAYIKGPEAISILSDAAVTITLEAGSENTLYDGMEEADPEATAVLRSTAPLSIGGEGSLTVLAGGNNGIQSKSVLTLAGGEITVKAANNAIKADSSLTITGGSYELHAGGDALRCEAGRISCGNITVTGGFVSAAADGRGLQADGAVTLSGGRFDIISAEDAVKGYSVSVTGGELAVNTAGDGVQADEALSISGGALRITAGEDGLRGGTVSVEYGDISVDAGGDGIQADTEIDITGGTLSVTGGEDGLRGDAVTIEQGDLSIDAGGDGVQAVTELAVEGGTFTVMSGEDGFRGDTVTIESGEIVIDAASDGIQADTDLYIEGGTLRITTAGGGGDAINKAGDAFGPMMWGGNQSASLDVSAKGLKSDGYITITGGVIDLNTADDAIHAEVSCTIDDGEIAILASDDALHSGDVLIINGGSIRITDCFEGLEAFATDVNGGDISIRAVNDGINANGSEFGMFGWGRSRQVETEAEITSLSGAATTYYRQTGGSVDIVITGNTSNCGDGIDSNGYVYIDGGVLTVSTRGDTQEGGIDTGRDGPVVTGGMVMAGGASMMQETWADESTQCCAVIYCDQQPAGTTITVYDEDGSAIWSVTMENVFNCIVLSHPDLQPGHVYTVDYGGGTETLDFTSSNNLRAGSSSSGWGMGGFGFPGGFR